ncbi:MAG: DUF5663 domain-containing protein [Candidatus Saccharimonadales bacterium]
MNHQFITQATLEALDVDLTGEDVEALLDHLNDTLQERISAVMTDALTDDQLKTLLAMQETASDEELGTWLEENVPDMQHIVSTETDILMAEILEEDGEEE